MRAVGKNCCTSMPEALLQAGADPCVCTAASSTTALHIAAAAGLTQSCDLLLAARAEQQIEMKDRNGWTALMHAAARGHPSTAQLLLQHGADITTVENDTKTLLMSASLQKQVGSVACLLKAGMLYHINSSLR
jgi:uncharacterized protein